MNPISLEGKVAVVTGGAGGIGRGIAESFAQLGARVIVADSNAESVSRLNEESRDRGWAIEAVECNVTKTAPVRARSTPRSCRRTPVPPSLRTPRTMK